MKSIRSAVVLFFFSIASVAAQPPTAPGPAVAPFPAPAASALPPPQALPPASTPVVPPASAAPTAEVPANPLGAPTPTAIDIKLPDAGSAATADDIPDPNTPMEKAFFPNTEIRDIIKTVAEGYQLNVSIPETLTGVTTIALRHVTWQQIFFQVLDPVGFTYVVNGDISTNRYAIIEIKNKADVAAEPMVTQVIPVNSAKAADLAKSLVQFLDSKSTPPETIVPDERTNFLIVTAHPSKMSSIQEAIERLDKPTQQVSIEAKFIELDANDDKNLGILWNFNGTQIGAADLAWQYNIAHGLGAINQSGTIPSQGVLAQTVDGAAESSLSAPANQNLNNAQPTSALAANLPSTSRRAADLAFFNQAEYAATLVAMQNITNARLVSSPKGVTLDNKELTLFSGTNITIVFPTVNNQTGQTTPGQITNYLIGITLRVTPHVTNDGFINLTLNPELSRIDPQQDTYFGATYPRIDSRKLTDANVSIKDGFTLAIGGLIDDQDSKATTQTPILGDLPVLGNLFRSTETIRQRNNLIIFITAKTLNRDGATYRDVISPEMMIRTGVTAQDLPGYYDNTRVTSTPNMPYVSPDEQAEMDAIQKARNEAEYLQNMEELREQLQEANSGIPAAKKSGSSSSSGGLTRH